MTKGAADSVHLPYVAEHLKISRENQVSFHVKNQYFTIGPEWEGKEEAEWFKEQLGVALAKLIEGSPSRKTTSGPPLGGVST